MNSHKFCFIICSNNTLLLNESIHYIQHLTVPEGYETDLLTINDAPSIAEGYNAALKESDAKYKIYMHQDVFLLNKNLLQNLLDIFQADSRIGLIGLVGYETIAPDGIMWHIPRRGTIYSRNPPQPYPPLSDYYYSVANDGYFYAALIDGLFMATAYDLPWDSGHLKGWDFYDAFQSMRYLYNGYRIAVPSQKHPWCLHDDNVILNLSEYDHYRRLFCSLYKDALGKDYLQIMKSLQKP